MNRDATVLRQAFATHAPTGRPVTDDVNFFEIGFTSAALATVLVDLRAAGLPLSLVDLFRFPTLSALTAEVAVRTGRPQAPSRPPWAGRGR